MKVKELPPGVIKKLRSDVAFTTVAQCVEELVWNSIDARANCIAVRLNLEQYKIQVVDNGHGIPEKELHMVGERYATSKCHAIEDLKSLKYVGYRGEALSSLKDVSLNLMIETRAAESEKTFCKIFTFGKNDKVCPSLNQRQSKGTTVTVFDFMYNRPVRKNTISEALDLEETRKLLQSIALMHPQISFSLLSEVTGTAIVQFKKCSSVQNAFMQLFGRDKSKNLKPIDEGFEDYRINGFVSMDCFPNKELQFLYVNKQPILRNNNLHKVISRTLCKFLCGKQKGKLDCVISTPNVASPSKTQAQFCAFVINISCPLSKYDSMFDRRHKVVEFSEGDKISGFVEKSILKFFNAEYYNSIEKEESFDPTLLQNPKDLTLRLGVDNYKSGLFSHAAKRHNDAISFAENHNIISEKHTTDEGIVTVTNNKTSYVSLIENKISLFNRLELKESDSQSKNFICLKNNEHCKSLFDSLKLTCKTTVADCRYRTTEKCIQTSKNVAPKMANSVSVKSSVSLDIPSRRVFPTKSPVMLRVPIKSNLSLLEKNNSIIQKLRQKYSYNPPKMKQISKLTIKSGEAYSEKHTLSFTKDRDTKEIGQSNSECMDTTDIDRNDPELDKILDIPQTLGANVPQRVASKFSFGEDPNLSPLKRFRRTKANHPNNEIKKLLTIINNSNLVENEVAKNKNSLETNFEEELNTNKTMNFPSQCKNHNENSSSNLRKRLPEFPLKTFNEEINLTSPSKIQRVSKPDEDFSPFEILDTFQRISSKSVDSDMNSPSATLCSKLNQTCLLKEFIPEKNMEMETDPTLNNDISVIDSNNSLTIAQNNTSEPVIHTNNLNSIIMRSAKYPDENYPWNELINKTLCGSNNLDTCLKVCREKLSPGDNLSLCLLKSPSTICSTVTPNTGVSLERNPSVQKLKSLTHVAHSTLKHTPISESEVPFNHDPQSNLKINSVCEIEVPFTHSTLKLISISELKSSLNQNGSASNKGNSIDLIEPDTKSRTFSKLSPKNMKVPLIGSLKKSSHSSPEIISNLDKASLKIISNSSSPQMIKIPIITTKSMEPTSKTDKSNMLLIDRSNSDEIFSLLVKNSNLDFHVIDDESQISFKKSKNKLFGNSSEIEILEQAEDFNVLENSNGSQKERTSCENGEVDSEKIKLQLNDEPCTIVSLPNNLSQGKENRWVCQVDNETKRVSYVDIRTGNSTYLIPKQLQKKSSKMEESVNLNKGTHKKHFFLTHDFSPFVKNSVSPTEKDKSGEDISILQFQLDSFINDNDENELNVKWRHSEETTTDKTDNSIQDLFSKWENPMFEIPSEAITAEDPRMLQSLSHMYSINSYRFTKATLKSLRVIGQVDCKFIACILEDFNEISRGNTEIYEIITLKHFVNYHTTNTKFSADIENIVYYFKGQRLLALFDQHAVHERIRLEELVEELYETSDDDEKVVKSSKISPSLEITLEQDEVRLLNAYQMHLRAIGFKLLIKNESDIEVFSIPSCMIDQNTYKLKRCLSEVSSIIEKSIKEWLTFLTQSRCKSTVLPKTLLNVLNSQACRGAIKFGDPLTLLECEKLLASLSDCKLPFQCAHGRPSITPLLDLNKIEELNKKQRPPPQLQKLKDMEEETMLYET